MTNTVHPTDAIAIVEAMYEPAPHLGEWLQRIGEATRTELGDGVGFVAAPYEIASAGRVAIGEHVAIGIAPEAARRLCDVVHAFSSDVVRDSIVTHPCALVTTVGSDATRARSRGVLRELGWRELFVLNGLDPSRHGACVAIVLDGERSLASRDLASWKLIAAHLAASYRLRRDASGVPEAIVTTTGQIEHAVGDARFSRAQTALREAVLAIERARSAELRRDHDSVARWPALVAGRWTLVDALDHDGRRQYLAYGNDPPAVEHHVLTRRERQVIGYAALGHTNLLVAYELGLPVSTIDLYLSVAMEKLGVASREALIEEVGAFGSLPGATSDD